MKTYMVVEQYKNGKYDEVYERFEEKGRMLPDGLYFVDNWVSQSANRCYQVMRTDDVSTFDQWIPCWSDLVDFEVVEIDHSSSTT